jgi:tetratricopeptide (TPR) repeat protein
MATATKIFISATSSDLRTFRNQVKTWMLDMGWLPVVQDHFAPDDNTVVEMLRKRMAECDAVVHIIGQAYGAEPQSPVKGQPRKSFTQLEAVFARKMRKRLFTVLLDEDFPYDPHEPEAPDLRVLQQAYRLQVATGEHLYIPCRAPNDLESEIRKLRVEFDRLRESRRRTAMIATPLLLAGLAGGIYYLGGLRHNTDTIIAEQQVSETRADARQKRLETLFNDTAGSGAASVHALTEIRDLLRPGNPDIDNIPAEQLPGLVKRILADLQRPAARAADFSGTVKQVLTDVQASTADLKFGDAAKLLDDALKNADTEDADRARGHAALLAERGRVSRLQLRYREAEGYYRQAAAFVATDPVTARGYSLEAAASLYAQGKEFGDNAALSDAIQAYGSALATVSREQAPLDWAAIENDLGNALERLGERDSASTRLEAAVAAYQEVLKVRTRENRPLEWAATQNDLGFALERLGERDSGTARYEAAIAAYNEALKERSQDHTPVEWALTQNNLGNAQLRLGENESGTTMLEAAIQSYSEALKVRTREAAPLDWATTKSNLGLALLRLGEHETGTARMEEAVAAYTDALTARTRERVPLYWAETQNNLGLALEKLAERETGTERLEAAAAAFTEALKERTRERVPHDWADTQNSLGIVLCALGERETGTTHLEQAVAAHMEALKENTLEEDPRDWAMTQDNLGTALTALGERESGTARLEAAVAAYNDALKIYTRENEPLDWALAQSDLGNALAAIGERETGTAHLEAAITAYGEALKVRTHDKIPLDWAISTGDQGIAMMTLAKRTGNAEMAKDAAEKIEVALTTTQGGGDRPSAANYGARLTEARALVAQLAKAR